jgi:hypothetical protein
MYLKTLDDGLAENQGRYTVRFALDVYSVSATNKSGYSYDAKDLLPPEMTSDPFADLREDLKAPPAITAEQKKLLSA